MGEDEILRKCALEYIDLFENKFDVGYADKVIDNAIKHSNKDNVMEAILIERYRQELKVLINEIKQEK